MNRAQRRHAGKPTLINYAARRAINAPLAQPVPPALQSAVCAALDRWNSHKWEWHKNGPTADLMAELYAEIKASS